MLDKTIVNIIIPIMYSWMFSYFLFQLLVGLPEATEELGFLKL